MIFHFKSWIERSFDGDAIYKKIKGAANYLGCSERTARRLYDGYEPKHVQVYVNLAKKWSDPCSKIKK